MLTADLEESEDVEDEQRIDVVWFFDGHLDVLDDRLHHSVPQDLLAAKVRVGDHAQQQVRIPGQARVRCQLDVLNQDFHSSSINLFVFIHTFIHQFLFLCLMRRGGGGGKKTNEFEKEFRGGDEIRKQEGGDVGTCFKIRSCCSILGTHGLLQHLFCCCCQKKN